MSWESQMRWTLFDGYLFKYCSVKHQTFHQVSEKTSQQTYLHQKTTWKAFQMPPRAIKHQLTCPIELTSGSFLIGRRDILFIPRNRLEWRRKTLYNCKWCVFGAEGERESVGISWVPWGCSVPWRCNEKCGILIRNMHHNIPPIPQWYWISPFVLKISMQYDIPPIPQWYWIFPLVLKISLFGTQGISHGTEHTLYRVSTIRNNIFWN